MYMGEASEQCLLCATYKTSFSSTSGEHAGLLQRGPLRPAHLCANIIYCGRCVIGSGFGAAFRGASFVGSHPRAPGDPSGPAPSLTNHPCGASGTRFVASRPLSPACPRDGSLMGLGCLRESPGAQKSWLCSGPPPLPDPFPSRHSCFSFVPGTSPHAHGPAGEGQGRGAHLR